MIGFQAIKCRLGFHQWGEWTYTQASESDSGDSCLQRRTCRGCQLAQARVDGLHRWVEAPLSDHASARVCEHCGIVVRSQVNQPQQATRSESTDQVNEDKPIGRVYQDTRINTDQYYGTDKDVWNSQRSEEWGFQRYD